ncbi:MAG: hypothetical protein R6U32_03865 [Candidatus Woesearchaeota archaeon]
MTRTPRLGTIEMIRGTIKAHNREYSVYQLWKALPKKMMYQTFKRAIEYLTEMNEIITDNRGKIAYIMKKTEARAVKREDILSSLSHYGYELITAKKIRGKIIPLDDLIIAILLRFPEARFIEAIPTLLIKNSIDKFELYRKAYDNNLVNETGFLLDISLKLSKKPGLKGLLKELEKQKQAKIRYLTSAKDRDFLEKRAPDMMKKWNLRGLFSLDDFRKEVYL